MTKKTTDKKDSSKGSKSSAFRIIKILIFLGLAIAGGFSGTFFDKYDLKQKFISFRHNIYNYFSSEPVKVTILQKIMKIL